MKAYSEIATPPFQPCEALGHVSTSQALSDGDPPTHTLFVRFPGGTLAAHLLLLVQKAPRSLLTTESSTHPDTHFSGRAHASALASVHGNAIGYEPPWGLGLLSLSGRDGGGLEHRGELVSLSHPGWTENQWLVVGTTGLNFTSAAPFLTGQPRASEDILTVLETVAQLPALPCPSWKASSPVYRPHNGPLSAEPAVKSAGVPLG